MASDQTNDATPRKPLRAAALVTEALQEVISAEGETAALARIHPLSRNAFYRLAAGMPVQPSTLIVAAARLGVDLDGALL